MSNKYLYRFRSMRDELVGRIFTHNELYFASPVKFNDPFDCKISVTVEGCSEEDVRTYFKNLSKNNPQAFLNVESLVKWALAHPDEFQQKINYNAHMANENNEKLGILCLSKPPDDILLWSHYADGHRGIAIQFDEEGFHNWIDTGSHGWLRPVEYPKDNKMPTLKESNKINIEEETIKDMGGVEEAARLHLERSIKETVRLRLLRKAKHWEYEGEYRAIIFPTEENQITHGYYNFPVEILTGVILGCQISDADRCSVEAWQKEYQPQLKIYKAVKDENSFSLNIEPPIETLI